MPKNWDFSKLDDWLDDVAEPPQKPEYFPDEYDIEKTYPFHADAVPRISYVELAWLGYYRVSPVGKSWEVTTCDGVVFRDSDRRTAVRNAQAYCTAFERGKGFEKHLPKPLRAITVKVRKGATPPF